MAKMIRVSKNFNRGALIKRAEEIKKLALERKSIYHRSWRIKPAAFYLSLQLSLVLNLIESKSIHKIIRRKNESSKK